MNKLLMFAASFLIQAVAVPTITLALDQKTQIGILVPLTGPVAEYGVAIKNGFELALGERKDL